jgi:hypothetical protein
MVIPGVPWWIAVPCNVAAAVAIMLLILDPHDNLPIALAVFIPAAVFLYGAALVRWLSRTRREHGQA